MIGNSNNHRRGTAALEFALAATILVPLTLGVVGIGMSLGNGQRVSQTVRDVGHMFARGVDFSNPEAKTLATRLAAGLGMTVDGGDGVLIISKIGTPTQAECDAIDPDRVCNNVNFPVFQYRVTIGNARLRASNYGSPAASILGIGPNIRAMDYLNHSTARAQRFDEIFAAAGLVQQPGEMAYLVEGYFKMSSLAFLGVGSGGTFSSPEPGGVYVRFVF